MLTAKVRILFEAQGKRMAREFTLSAASTCDALITVQTLVGRVYQNDGFRLLGSKAEAVCRN